MVQSCTEGPLGYDCLTAGRSKAASGCSPSGAVVGCSSGAEELPAGAAQATLWAQSHACVMPHECTHCNLNSVGGHRRSPAI